MKKLYQLKKWLTIEDTARHLSIVFGEPVSEADVLQLGLDGYLKLSVYFVNGAVAKRGKVVSYEQAKMYILPRDTSNVPIEELMPCYLNTVTITDVLPEEVKKGLQDQTLIFATKGFAIRHNEVLELEEEISHISKLEDVYDLPMIGAERLDIEHKYQMLTGGVEVTGVFLDGAYVVSQDGQFCQLLERFDDNPYSNSDDKKKDRAKRPLYDPRNYYPGSLPDDSALVVRTSELTEFESRISESEGVIEKPLTASERDSLLKLVIGMAMKGYSYDPNAKKNSAVADIAADLALLGLPLGDDTIRKYLKQGNEQLPAKPTNT